MTPELKGFVLVALIKTVAVFTFLMLLVAYSTLLERWIASWMQDRIGPNRAGPKGLLQPIADGIKNLLKEEVIPDGANKVFFVIAPAISLMAALIIPLTIPWAAPIPLEFDITLPLLGRFVHHGATAATVTALPIGFLFVLAISSVGVYGIALGGWASNNKYSLLGGLRATAQMVSYEVAMGLSLIPVLLLVGNVSFVEIVAAQQQARFGWLVLPLALSAFMFLVSGFAETNRVPFDMPEAESELVAGYHTEYSSMKFSAFMIAEFAGMVTISMMFVTLFLGGWDIPFTHWDETLGMPQFLATAVLFFLKVLFFLFLFMWVRWTLPRFRYDQLMALGWKVFIPMGLAYILFIAVALWVVDGPLGTVNPAARFGLLFLFNLPVLALVFRVLDRGRLIRGVSIRAPASAARPARAA
ncbi:MAG TPA: NADH-quinone oxidoreductase subunit NuoH [Gemmatimonadales bacterium]|nr:NADH-quinone oxidoreductase subunit NuoH [Gemmatimonadales bacterium]